MNAQYTDIQLKQALAKMLPDVIQHEAGLTWYRHDGGEVLDTELLHLCWLIEETLTFLDKGNYFNSFWEGAFSVVGICHISWQQRTIALAKVKGVEIV